MIAYPTLYKRTTTGKVQIWFMEIDGDKYRTTSGQQDGKKVTSEWTVAKPKNVGRANATTAEEQAVAEVEAAYEKQRKSNYHDDINNIDNEMFFKPMLASKWKDRKGKINEPHVHIQPKLDGIRCIAKADGLWSRNGELIVGAPHIYEKLKPLFEKTPDLVLDGELYNHDLKDNFNAIVSCVKKKKPTAADLKVSEESIQYWVYDLPSHDGHFNERFEALTSIMAEADNHFVVTDTLLIATSLVDKHASEWIELGYEGAMVRLDGKYEGKRSNSLIKWKEFQDEEFPIVDIVEGDGNRTGMAARVVLSLPNGETFKAGMIGNEEYCRQLLLDKDQHIGKMGTVVFQNYTPDGVPRFPKFKGVRFDC